MSSRKPPSHREIHHCQKGQEVPDHHAPSNREWHDTAGARGAYLRLGLSNHQACGIKLMHEGLRCQLASSQRTAKPEGVGGTTTSIGAVRLLLASITAHQVFTPHGRSTSSLARKATHNMKKDIAVSGRSPPGQGRCPGGWRTPRT